MADEDHKATDPQATAGAKAAGKKVATTEPRAPLVAGNKLAAIVPTDIEGAWRLAGVIAAANMAPKSYNRDQNAIMVGILHGLEVGLTPMAALQSIAVINGVPSIWGDGALGLVRASGLLEDFVELLEGEGDGIRAVCTLRRRGQQSTVSRSFSVADAKRAGLWSKAGPWQQYPQRMLQMRARSWALRDGFADVLRGLSVAEEMQEIEGRALGPLHEPETPRPSLPAQAIAEHAGQEQGASPTERGLPAEQGKPWPGPSPEEVEAKTGNRAGKPKAGKPAAAPKSVYNTWWPSQKKILLGQPTLDDLGSYVDHLRGLIKAKEMDDGERAAMLGEIDAVIAERMAAAEKP